MVNSGSSANLLALQCLINPYRKKRLNPGDEVLIPSLCWSTSLWPIIQSGLSPKFVDVDLDSLNINLKYCKAYYKHKRMESKLYKLKVNIKVKKNYCFSC